MEGAILKLAEGIMSFPKNTFKNSAFFPRSYWKRLGKLTSQRWRKYRQILRQR